MNLHIIFKKIARKLNFILRRFLLLIFPLLKYNPGSKYWFISAEKRFGSYTTEVANKISEKDKRSIQELIIGPNTGGDRMLIHGYSKYYAKYLNKFIKARENKFSILEVGIFNGIGLAVWSTLFPNSKIYGADIDLLYFRRNLLNLKNKGAFKTEDPIVFEFDQLDTSLFQNLILEDLKFDIVIDDGLHSRESILNTLEYFYPLLSQEFVYFIEDVRFDILEEIKLITNNCNIKIFGELIIIYRK